MKRLCFLALLLVVATAVHAQDCAGGGVNAGGVCVPPDVAMPNNQQQAPPPVRWANQWGAIATDNQLGKLGASMNNSDQASAESLAMSQCQSKGGTQCKILISFYNQCGAVIIGDGKIGANSAATIAQASEGGLKVCNAATTNCHVYYTACSMPVRIQ